VAHDPALAGDPTVFELIAAAAGLAMSNSATQADIRRRVGVVDASRERLVQSADAQGRLIESAIEHGVEARLARVDDLVMLAANARPTDPHLHSVGVDIAATRGRLRDFAEASIRRLAVGWSRAGHRRPRTALDGSGHHAPRSPPTRYDPAIESTLYFVCSEALANVAKALRCQSRLDQARRERRWRVPADRR